MKNYIIEELRKHYNSNCEDKSLILRKNFKYIDLADIIQKAPLKDHDILLEIQVFLLSNSCLRDIKTSINLSSYLKSKLQNLQLKVTENIIQLDAIYEVSEILKELSDESYIVGGFVRDSLLNLTPKDADFVTDVSYDRLKKVFEFKGWKVLEVGKEFLVLKISKEFSGKREEIDIAQFRTESNYTDGRHPDTVSVGDIISDSARRDFCINSLYFRLNDYEIIDPTGYGISDSIDRILRFSGKAEDRLKDDALRAWRFWRLLTTKGLKPDLKSLRAIRSNFDEIYSKSNPTRVREEVEKMLKLN